MYIIRDTITGLMVKKNIILQDAFCYSVVFTKNDALVKIYNTYSKAKKTLEGLEKATPYKPINKSIEKEKDIFLSGNFIVQKVSFIFLT